MLKKEGGGDPFVSSAASGGDAITLVSGQRINFDNAAVRTYMYSDTGACISVAQSFRVGKAGAGGSLYLTSGTKIEGEGTAAISMPSTDSTGTPGAATVDKSQGKSSIASGASAVTITNSLVATTSNVLITPMDADTAIVKYKCVPGTGSFVVTGYNAAGVAQNAAANWRFMWFVFTV
jgi:hypothetical protein